MLSDFNQDIDVPTNISKNFPASNFVSPFSGSRVVMCGETVYDEASKSIYVTSLRTCLSENNADYESGFGVS
jgi:hypothetical protein